MRKHRYLKNNCNFFDTLKTKDCKIRGNCNSLIKVKFQELEWSSPLSLYFEEVNFLNLRYFKCSLVSILLGVIVFVIGL